MIKKIITKFKVTLLSWQNDLPQCVHENLIFSCFVCLCLFRLHCWLKAWLQISQVKDFSWRWIAATWVFKCADWENFFGHSSHWYCLIFSCIILMCFLRSPFWPKLFPQRWHLNAFTFSWTVWKWATRDRTKINLFEKI